MAKQKLSLEDILDEYSDSNDKKSSDTQTTDNNYVRDILRNHNKNNKINDGTLRRPNPANDYKPSDIGKPDISFINSIGIDRLRSPKNKSNISAYDGAVVTNQGNSDDNYTPKIRPMSDSTRAKEIENRKKNKKRKHKSDFTYSKETPDGEYLYTPLSDKDKRKSGKKSSYESKGELSDVLPSPQSIKNDKLIKPAPRADITSINLSEDFRFDSESLDIKIEHGENLNKKSLSDFNHYGNAGEIGKNIKELRNSIFTRFTTILVCAILSIYLTVANCTALPVVNFLDVSQNIQGFTFAQILIGMVAIISSAPVIIHGLKNLFKLKADSDSLSALVNVICLISAIVSLFTPKTAVNIYIPVAILTLLFNTIGKILIIKRAERNFKVLSKQSERSGIVSVQDDVVAETLTRGTLGDFPILASMQKTDFLTDFLKYTYSSDITDKFCKRSLIFSFAGSFLISGCIALVRQCEISTWLSMLSMFMCVSSCMGITLVSNIPLNNASKKFIKNKGVILGYQSVDDFYDTNSVLVEASSLFPENSVSLAGVKVFSDTKIDEAMLEAGSLANHADSVIKGVFNDITENKKNQLYKVENFSYEDSMGLCGWINNKRVLLGNRELMMSHNIEGMPTKTKENEFTGGNKEAVYLSVSGNLSALFVVEIKADQNVKKWVQELDKNNVHMIIKSVDSCITLRRLSELFEIPEELMRILPKKLHPEFESQTKKTVRLSASMSCSGKFSEFIKLILATKSIYSCSVIGLIIQAVSIVLGIVLGSVMIISNTLGGYVSAPAIIIYNLLFALITALIVNIKKF